MQPVAVALGGLLLVMAAVVPRWWRSVSSFVRSWNEATAAFGPRIWADMLGVSEAEVIDGLVRILRVALVVIGTAMVVGTIVFVITSPNSA